MKIKDLKVGSIYHFKNEERNFDYILQYRGLWDKISYGLFIFDIIMANKESCWTQEGSLTLSDIDIIKRLEWLSD